MSKALTKKSLQQVLDAICKYYPASYADNAWDNTGLLIDCSTDDAEEVARPKVLLTVDLTASVADEAIANNCNVILSYHPFIFPSWKSLSPSKNPQHRSAIKLIQQGISVYSPHTAVDAAKNGVNDWLSESLVTPNMRHIISSNVSIEKIASQPVNGENDAEVGYGRIMKFTQPLTLQQIVRNVKQSLGLKHVQVASLHKDLATHKIHSVALCAGSGSGVFKSMRDEVDLYYTGELSHHEVLKYKEQGKAVIVCNHSNTERAYVRTAMQKILNQEGLECVVSETDEDPLQVV